MIQLLLMSWLVLGVGMTVIWGLSIRYKNYAFVDVGWSFGFLVVVLLVSIFSSLAHSQSTILAFMIGLHSLRLGTYLFKRTVGKPEEGRYASLRESWKNNLPLKFWFFFQAQALSIIFLLIPFWLTLMGDSRHIGIIESVAIALFIVSMFGESLADRQLEQFKKNARTGEVCKQGLWAYSRHPNYFFECLIWVSYALYASHVLAWSSPIIMIILIWRITGIPPSEEQNLKSKGMAYEKYQKETSVLIPWPRRKSPIGKG